MKSVSAGMVSGSGVCFVRLLVVGGSFWDRCSEGSFSMRVRRFRRRVSVGSVIPDGDFQNKN